MKKLELIDLEKIKNYQTHSYDELGKLLHVNEKTVRNLFKREKITKQQVRIKARDFKIEVLKLASEKYTAVQIAKILNKTPRQITVFCNTQKIKLNRSRTLYFSEIEYQVVLGSILGDGHIKIYKKAKSSNLYIQHCIEQFEYINYKYILLKRICPSKIKIKERFDARFKNSKYTTCILTTSTCLDFADLRKKWYQPKKIIHHSVFDLEPLGLAIWYMDDGYYNDTAHLCTNGFLRKDCQFLQYMLLKKFKIHTTLNKKNIIRIRKNSYIIFYNLIKEFMIPTMQYKLPK